MKKKSIYFFLPKFFYKEIIIWYSFSFLASFLANESRVVFKKFPFQNNNYSFLGLKIAHKDFFLLSFSLFIFSIFLNLLAEILANFIEERTKELLRKKIINKLINHQNNWGVEIKEEVTNSFFSEVELFVPLFFASTHRFILSFFRIFLELSFLSSLKFDRNSSIFLFLISLVFTTLLLLTYPIQKQAIKKINNLRLEENTALQRTISNSVEQKNEDLQSIITLIEANSTKKFSLILQRNFTKFSTMMIPGLNVLFALIFYRKQTGKELIKFLAIASSIQGIFWRFKELIECFFEFSHFSIYKKSLNRIIE